jgi:hypothetical protein
MQLFLHRLTSKLRLCGIYNYSHLLSISYYAISIIAHNLWEKRLPAEGRE